MPDKVIKAKNVVSFADAPATEEVETPVMETAAEGAPIAKRAAKAPNAEPLEINPLNLRKSRYVDEAPQDGDWADEEDDFDPYETEDEGEDISTFAEVFIPLHDDSTGAVIRKGMVIVSCIVIVCCLVAILMKSGAVGGTILFDVPALKAQAVSIASSVLVYP